MADLERLQQLDSANGPGESKQALAAAASLRERIRSWQEAHDIPAGNLVTDLTQLREERDAELSSMP